jgi:hypothetical protein
MTRFASGLATAFFFALAACGARNELHVDEPVDGGGTSSSTGGTTDCAIGTETFQGKDYCVCQRFGPDQPTTIECPAGETCCEPIHPTDDLLPYICAPAGDAVCHQ